MKNAMTNIDQIIFYKFALNRITVNVVPKKALPKDEHTHILSMGRGRAEVTK